MAALPSHRLRIGRREAAGRVRLAADLAPRRAVSGEQLPDRLPDQVVADQPELVAQIEPTLLDLPRTQPDIRWPPAASQEPRVQTT